MRTALALAAIGVMATGCSRSAELHVPFSLDQKPFVDDLRRSGVRIPIVPGTDRFQLCDPRSDRCLPVEFVDDHLESTVSDAVALLLTRARIERIVIVSDTSQPYDTQSLSHRDIPVVDLRAQDDESIDAFLQRIVESVDLDRDGIVAILDEHTPDLIRRLGRSDSAVGVIPELFLSGAGDRFRAAGYPIIGSISPDMTKILARDRELPKDRATTYVDLRLFRY